MSGPRWDAGPIVRLFGELPVLLIGAHAANAFMPPRATQDVDFLVPYARFGDAEAALRRAGMSESRRLLFPNAKLELFGSAWHRGDSHLEVSEIDVITSPQAWCAEAFASAPASDQNGARIVPLPYLVLMKLDSARTVDQADLGRMLGRLDDAAVEEVVRTVTRHYDDPQAADDIRQYAAIGRWEYERD